MERKRYFHIMTVLISLGIIVSLYFDTLAIVWDDYVIRSRLESPSKAENEIGNLNGVKTVLFWNDMFANKWHYLGESGHFDECPRYRNCRATASKDLLPNVTDFDVLLFHGISVNKNNLPARRDPGQIYVFVDLESPMNWPIPGSLFDGYYNATMTYRLDSDFPRPYRTMREIRTNKVVAPFEQVEWPEPSYEETESLTELKVKYSKKSKMASWLVSHCDTRGKRDVYVKEMQKYGIVDIIGKCAPKRRKIICPNTDDCFARVIEPNYFYYLAFENTLCKDYVTEKFFNAMRYDVIPVVYGGANYSLFAPPHSYIDALDFESPKALADYLIELSKDRDEYLKYFWWKRFYAVDYVTKHVMCRICEILNEPVATKSYSPLSDWFAKDKCPMQDILKGERYATKSTRDRAIEEQKKKSALSLAV